MNTPNIQSPFPYSKRSCGHTNKKKIGQFLQQWWSKGRITKGNREAETIPLKELNELKLGTSRSARHGKIGLQNHRTGRQDFKIIISKWGVE